MIQASLSRFALPLACVLLTSLWVLVPNSSTAASTNAIADTSGLIGSITPVGDGDYVVVGPVAGPAEADAHTLVTVPGVGYVDSHMESRADYGRLRSRAVVQIAAPYSSANAGSSTAFDPNSSAFVDDTILITSRPGGVHPAGLPHTFRVVYSLTGFAGQTGSATLQFGAKAGLQARGTGITIVLPQTE